MLQSEKKLSFLPHKTIFFFFLKIILHDRSVILWFNLIEKKFWMYRHLSDNWCDEGSRQVVEAYSGVHTEFVRQSCPWDCKTLCPQTGQNRKHTQRVHPHHCKPTLWKRHNKHKYHTSNSCAPTNKINLAALQKSMKIYNDLCFKPFTTQINDWKERKSM